MTEIPADVMKAALRIKAECNVDFGGGIGGGAIVRMIADAIMGERERQQKIQLSLCDAINFTIEEGGVEFLKSWTEGDWQTVESEYPKFDMTSTAASGARS